MFRIREFWIGFRTTWLRGICKSLAALASLGRLHDLYEFNKLFGLDWLDHQMVELEHFKMWFYINILYDVLTIPKTPKQCIKSMSSAVVCKTHARDLPIYDTFIRIKSGHDRMRSAENWKSQMIADSWWEPCKSNNHTGIRTREQPRLRRPTLRRPEPLRRQQIQIKLVWKTMKLK